MGDIEMSSSSSSWDEEDAHLLTCDPEEVGFDWLNLLPAHARGCTGPAVVHPVGTAVISAKNDEVSNFCLKF